jgi:hypothetical protein
MGKIKQLSVTLISEDDLNELRTFLTDVGDRVKEFERFDENQAEANEEIGKMVRKHFPYHPVFIALLNLGHLLDNNIDTLDFSEYAQDKS